MEELQDTKASLAESSRNNVKEFLQWCDIPYPRITPDTKLFDACYEDADRRGCTGDNMRSLLPFIRGGVAMAMTAYAHLEDLSAKHDVTIVSEFNQRFISNQPKGTPALDAFANLLMEMPERYGKVASNIMITSTLNLVTALILENETQDMKISPTASSYATFARYLSGASETYAIFAFPKEIPITQFIQTMPDIVIFINNGNDVLSYYKEEISGESVNRVSLLATCWTVPKAMVVRYLGAEAAAAHDRVLRTLRGHTEAYTAYHKFSRGYIGFHAALSRYRLNELNL